MDVTPGAAMCTRRKEDNITAVHRMAPGVSRMVFGEDKIVNADKYSEKMSTHLVAHNCESSVGGTIDK